MPVHDETNDGDERRRVLIAEDDGIIALMMQNALISSGFQVAGMAARAEEAIHLCDREKPDLAIIDIRLAGPLDGIDLATRISPALMGGILFATGNPDVAVARGGGLGVACLRKPYLAAELIGAIRFVDQMIRGEGVPVRIPPGLLLLSPAFSRGADRDPR
jgi:DNA-binding response OmpR family regulator